MTSFSQFPISKKLGIEFAPRRDNYGDKSVSENDAIFCNPMHWIAKNGIVFAYSNSKN
jgi:hypothetical protein